jgi:NO-binding membrane sensor protein with MHYT domain
VSTPTADTVCLAVLVGRSRSWCALGTVSRRSGRFLCLFLWSNRVGVGVWADHVVHGFITMLANMAPPAQQ